MTITTEQPEVAYLTPADAAKYISVAPVTLARWRKNGTGPDYSGAGKLIRYAKATLDAFMAARSTKAVITPDPVHP